MRQRTNWWLCCALIGALGLLAHNLYGVAFATEDEKPAAEIPVVEKPSAEATPAAPAKPAEFVEKGVAWLIAAQHPDGGWGGGSHAHQEVRDPSQVPTDPGTTAFTLLALLRAGETPVAGEQREHVRRGLEYLVAAVEKSPAEGPRITDITGTQPQTKLGQYVDTPLTAQYLARAFATLDKQDPLYDRVNAALDKCLGKLQTSQQADGSWGQGGGWAPVLQSSLSCSALEIAQASGKPVEAEKLVKAREYQKQQVTTSAEGKAVAKTDAAAGVELYAFNGALRGGASETREAKDAIAKAVDRGELPAAAPVTEANLQKAGIASDKAKQLADVAAQNEQQIRRLDDESLLAGFGNNGGEEYLSYLLTSESLVIAGGDKFNQWNDKMHGRLQKIQNTDGSWSGLHCITSPVFCTAAVVQCLTADRDREFLVAMSARTQKAQADEAVAKK